ncbi:MAG: 16S rRNA (cytidine(1402)-2'-O)-methyltransferase [Polyangiaceae bacterium]|nr:16S rRNA (cytidine(1402)-2'-O)-methyltransferase [Polyangiaceae bacterium]
MSAPAGVLRLVATPIGNLSDLAPRAVEALRTADVILAEDTRRARALCSHLGLAGKRIERFDAEVERRGVDRLVERLRAGETLALVSDAGMPAVSDPGAELVRAAAAAGVGVIPVAGPSAVTAAVAASGFGGGYRFLGFLARGGAERERALARIAATEEPVVLFESPERLGATLRELAVRWPGRSAVVARELTKVHEELVRGALVELARAEREWRGEITLVLGPAEPAPEVATDEATLDARLRALCDSGVHPRAAAKAVALESGLAVSVVYARLMALRS